MASRPRQIDESGASPRPKGSRVESRSTSRPRSRDSSASSRSPPRDVGRHAHHSSPDSVVGQDEAVMPECRSRPRSSHGWSTGDRRSSVDRRAPGSRSTGGAVDRRPISRVPVDRRLVSQLPVDRRAFGARSIGGRSIGGR